jgi:hypothetical protein
MDLESNAIVNGLRLPWINFNQILNVVNQHEQTATERNLQTLKQVYWLHSSQTAFATFAMTSSRIVLLALESETKTAIAKCCPFGSVTSPTSLVAAVTPSTVAEVPVLCATTVPSGNNPLIRFGPVESPSSIVAVRFG